MQRKQNKIQRIHRTFCGSLGVMRHMTSEDFPCYASDACQDIILLWKQVQLGKYSKFDISKEEWIQLKSSKSSSPARAVAGFKYSFGGQWFSGYSGDYETQKQLMNRKLETMRSFKRLEPQISKVEFYYKDYREWNKVVNKGGYLIYCDPPYENTNKRYGIKTVFNNKEFWDTVRIWRSQGNIVVISEKSAPRDFRCIWKKELQKSLIKNGKGFYIDKLFI